MSDEILVFVYGTLRKGFRNEHYLKEHECLCDNSESLSKAQLLLFFDRPYIDFNNPQYPIKGEIYKINSQTLEKLDELEDHPVWYRRVEKSFYSQTLNKDISAYCYEISDPPEKKFLEGHKTGCYKDFMQKYDVEIATNFEIQDDKIIRLG
jgi:gamma-glutamylaminecyclotransferase